jgi:small nuclear ribonucleoprotein (snRNP)-like protein
MKVLRAVMYSNSQPTNSCNHHSIPVELHDGLRSIGRLDSVDQMNIHQKLYDFNARDDDENRLVIPVSPVTFSAVDKYRP